MIYFNKNFKILTKIIIYFFKLTIKQERIDKLKQASKEQITKTNLESVQQQQEQQQQQQQPRISLAQQEEDFSGDSDYEIEISIEESQQSREQAYEEGLRDIAKYLVNEITQISVNKLKIDALNETLDRKYFTKNLETKQEILNSFVQEEESLISEVGTRVDESGGVGKSREKLFEYYTNLEKNLETVRAEIDKLKQEAYEDLAYISNILVEDKNENLLVDESCEVDEDIDDMEDKLADEFDRQVGKIEEEIRDREMKLKIQEATISQR